MREQPTIPVVLTESRARGETLVYHSNGQVKEQSYPTSAPPPLSRLWERTEYIVPNRGQTFFPEAPPGAIYDVTIMGTISYHLNFILEGDTSLDPGTTLKSNADAMYMTTSAYSGSTWYDFGLFNHEHGWFRINGQAITEKQLLDNNGRRDPWGLEANRNGHIYRLRLEGITETLFLACESEAALRQHKYYKRNSFRSEGFLGSPYYFTVAVTAWVPASPAIAQFKAASTAPSTPEDLRQHKVLEHSRAIEDRLAIVEREIEIEQAVIERVARKYPRADQDVRQRMVQRILERMYEEEGNQNVEQL